MASVLKGFHSFTCTPSVHPLMEWTKPAWRMWNSAKYRSYWLSHQANQVGLWVQLEAAIVRTHHCCLLLLSATADTRFIIPRRVEGCVDLSTAGTDTVDDGGGFRCCGHVTTSWVQSMFTTLFVLSGISVTMVKLVTSTTLLTRVTPVSYLSVTSFIFIPC